MLTMSKESYSSLIPWQPWKDKRTAAPSRRRRVVGEDILEH